MSPAELLISQSPASKWHWCLAGAAAGTCTPSRDSLCPHADVWHEEKSLEAKSWCNSYCKNTWVTKIARQFFLGSKSEILIVMGVTGINCVCNVVRPNQDVFPAGCLVKKYLGVLLPSMENKILHCHWPQLDSGGRNCVFSAPLWKLTGVRKGFFSSLIFSEIFCMPAHTLWLIILSKTLLFILFSIKKNGCSRYTLFSPLFS